LAEEFVIKSQQIEDKINQLLPSQGGFQAGVDFSASTMVIPIVDLTETAEGSALRQDLQSSLSLTTVTSTNISGTTTTFINTTGYFRIFGNCYIGSSNSPATNSSADIKITDGTTSKVLARFRQDSISDVARTQNVPFDFIVFLEAGDSVNGNTSDTQSELQIASRQLADINGNLVNP
tara:strand:- start:142 stop:675 length:534 start_codon:yes stop_codon:yes gene_type:complete